LFAFKYGKNYANISKSGVQFSFRFENQSVPRWVMGMVKSLGLLKTGYLTEGLINVKK